MNNKAISPVIGIILLLAITVILAAIIGIFVLDIGSPNYTPNAGVDVNQDRVTLIDKNNDAQEILIEGANGSSQSLENIGETERLANKGTYRIIAVAPDEETRQLIQTIEIEQADEDFTLLDQEEGDIKGKVMVNPPIEGAKVTVQGVGTTTTDENGIYSFKNVSGVKDGDSLTIDVQVNGFDSSELPGKFYAKYTGYNKELNGNKANIEFNDYKTSTVNGNTITTSHSVVGESEKQIHNQYQLSKLGTGTYQIKSNIEASNISSSTNTFEGTLNGNGYKINNLNNKLINNNQGEIKDLTISNTNKIETTIADTNNGKIDNVKVNEGLVSKSGLVDTNKGQILNSEYNGVIDAQGNNEIGGIASINKGIIKNVVTTGNIKNAGSKVGGIAGVNSINTDYYNLESLAIDGGMVTPTVEVKSKISNSNSKMNINTTGNTVGGIAGETTNKISNSPYYISKISNTNYDGNINSNNKVGGLVGFNKGILIDSSVSGNVIGNDNIGGSVGVEKGSYNNIDSSASVEGNDKVGGLVGNNKILSGNFNLGGVNELVELHNNYSTNILGFTFKIQNSEMPLTEISDSSASGSVDGSSNIGAIVGEDNVPESPLNSQHTDLSKVNVDIIEGEIMATDTLNDNFEINKNSNGNYDVFYTSSDTGNTYTLSRKLDNGTIINDGTMSPGNDKFGLKSSIDCGFLCSRSVTDIRLESGGEVKSIDVSSMSNDDNKSSSISSEGVTSIKFDYISSSSNDGYFIDVYDSDDNKLSTGYVSNEGDTDTITETSIIDKVVISERPEFVDSLEVGDKFEFKLG